MDTHKRIIVISLAISFILTIVGALFKIMHWPFASILIGVGLLLSLIYIVLCLIEISNSKKTNTAERYMWLVGFIFMAQITGLVYLSFARDRIIKN
jgi:hypothetical protein